ncbi:g9665 [Coccomyxa elongata]
MASVENSSQPSAAPAATDASGPSSGTADPPANTGSGTTTHGTHSTLEAYGATFLFDKQLTTSDAGGHGRVVIPKVHARAHLPSLEDKNGVHVEVIDTYGTRHRFRYCSWINNSSRMYLLEGVAPALNALKLKAGDILIFAKLANGELLLGGRTRTSADKDRKAPPRARKGSEQTTNGTPSGGIKRARTMNGTGVQQRVQRPNASHLLYRPLCDGVFRAVPPAISAKEYCGKVLQQGGTWTAILDVSGEAYQAFFDSQGAAMEALNAAGVLPRTP